jgi:hypothetical protein
MVGISMRKMALVISLGALFSVSAASAATLLLPANIKSGAVPVSTFGAAAGVAVINGQDESARALQAANTDFSDQLSATLDDRTVKGGLMTGGLALLAIAIRRKRRPNSVTA